MVIILNFLYALKHFLLELSISGPQTVKWESLIPFYLARVNDIINIRKKRKELFQKFELR